MSDKVTNSTASGFLGSLGINIHSGETTGTYGNTSLVMKSLNYLGIQNVRTALPTDGDSLAAQVNALANAGLKFDFVTSSGIPATGTAGLASYVNTLASFNAAHPGQVFAVEGLNEVNLYDFSWQGDSSVNGAVNFQQALYTAVKGNAALNGIPVINLSVALESASAYAQEGDVSRWSDFANDHAYTATCQTQQQSMQVSIANAQGAAKGKPLVITETGYTTSLDQAYLGVDQKAQAELTLTNLFNAYQDGSQKTYLYELFNSVLDPNEPTSEKNYGLFNADGSPKQAAVAVHNVTTILGYGDTADAQAPAAGAWSLVGAGASMHSLALGKSQNSYDLVLWSDTQAWDQAHAAEANVTPTQTKVHFGSAQANVYVYDPMAGTAPVAVYHNVTDITVPVGASPMIVEVGASGPVQDVPPTQPAQLEMSAAALMAKIDTYAVSTGIQSITIDGTHQLPVSTTDTMQYIISHYGDTLGKIQGGFQFVIDHSTDQWREVQVFDSIGKLVSTTDYSKQNGVAANSLQVMADGTRISTDMSTHNSMTVAPNGTTTLLGYAGNGVLTSSKVTATDGNVWTATFDTAGRKLTEGHSGPDGSSISVEYDPVTGNQSRVLQTDAAGNHFTDTYRNGAIDVHYAQFADGHSEVIQNQVTGQTFTKIDQVTDTKGNVVSVARFHADGTTDSTEWHTADGNIWYAWYDGSGKLTTTVHQAPDGTSTTASYDPATGQMTRVYNVLANGDHVTDLYANGAMTLHFVTHADGTSENIATNITGQSYTTQYQNLDASGHVTSVTRTHADGSLDYFEWDYADGRRDISVYDATGKLQTTTHIAADKSWSLQFAPDASGDVRTEQHDATGAIDTLKVAHANGSAALSTFAAGQTVHGTGGNDAFFLYGAQSTIAFAGGNDTVAAFQAGDHIQFTAAQAHGMADVHLTQTNAGVLVNVHGGSLLLSYTSLDHVPDGTFVFG